MIGLKRLRERRRVDMNVYKHYSCWPNCDDIRGKTDVQLCSLKCVLILQSSSNKLLKWCQGFYTYQLWWCVHWYPWSACVPGGLQWGPAPLPWRGVLHQPCSQHELWTGTELLALAQTSGSGTLSEYVCCSAPTRSDRCHIWGKERQR